MGSNADHGKRRSNADKRRSVELLLKDQDWTSWSDREIAKQCAVSHPFVAEIRKGQSPSLVTFPVSERTYTTKHGTAATMQTSNIGGKVKTDAEIEAAERRKVIKESDAFIAEMKLKEKNVCELIDAHNIPAEYHAALIEASKGWAVNSDASNKAGTSIAVKGFAWWDEKSGALAKRRIEVGEKAKHERLVKKFGEYPFETTTFSFVERLRSVNSGSISDLLQCAEHFDSLSNDRLEKLRKMLNDIRKTHNAGMDELENRIDSLLRAPLVEKDITPNQETRFLEDKSTD